MMRGRGGGEEEEEDGRKRITERQGGMYVSQGKLTFFKQPFLII